MFRTKTEFRNARRLPISIWVEPWAEEFRLKQNESLQIEFLARVEGMPEIEFHDEDNAVLVHGFPGSSARAFQDGKLIWECHQPLPQ